MLQFTVSIGAGKIHLEKTPGKYLSIKSTTLPLLASLQGGSKQGVTTGQVLGGGEYFGNVVFDNTANAIAVTVVFYIGDFPINFAPVDNSVIVAGTTAHGTYVAPATIPNVYNTIGNPPANANSGLWAYTISSAWNGRRRKSITFTVASSTAGDKVFILDASFKQFCIVTAAAPLQFESDDVFYAYCNTATCDLVIGELYY